jgi:hypothetical protein
MSRPKLSVRPTESELKRLHELAGLSGYDSLSAYMIDCGLSINSILPRERGTLESLGFHVRFLNSVIDENGGRKRRKIPDQLPTALLIDIAQRAHEALRLINVILGQHDPTKGSGGA